MSQRALQLQTNADEQIGMLIELLSNVNDATMHRPCAGREKLGDGTIGALAAHTADNFQRIATFVATGQSMSTRHGHRQHRRHRIPAPLRALGHTPHEHSQAGPHEHHDGFTAHRADPNEIVQRLSSARSELARIAHLTDQQLDTVPLKDAFRFCDGQRTLEQVLAGLLKHQRNQVQALQAALTPTQ